eukprot:c11888_g1_i1 orf=319-711(+)
MDPNRLPLDEPLSCHLGFPHMVAFALGIWEYFIDLQSMGLRWTCSYPFSMTRTHCILGSPMWSEETSLIDPHHRDIDHADKAFAHLDAVLGLTDDGLIQRPEYINAYMSHAMVTIGQLIVSSHTFEIGAG